MTDAVLSNTESGSQRVTGWLHGRNFDLCFIVGVAMLAIASGSLVIVKPELYLLVLTLDLWLLGYHHVASTYTRLVFDTDSFAEHRNKILYLPVLVAITVTAAVLLYGPWLLATIYLYWQWYHYTRQSEGISKAYAAKAELIDLIKDPVNRIIFYLIPFAGIITISARSPDYFLFMPVRTLAVPPSIAMIVQSIAVIALIWWIISQYQAKRRNQFSLPYCLYLCSHFLIYSLAYLFVDEINHGWLIINIWHNAQYILFVWLFNNKRFKNKIHEKHVLLSTLSRKRNFLMYVGFCLALSSMVYFLLELYGVDLVERLLGVSSIAAVMIIYQTINFHHYIVDAAIWKLRRKPVRATLDIQ